MIRRPPRSTLFPYTRSSDLGDKGPSRAADHPGARQAPGGGGARPFEPRSEEHTSELQSHSDLVCRLLLEKKNQKNNTLTTAKNTPATGATHTAQSAIENTAT